MQFGAIIVWLIQSGEKMDAGILIAVLIALYFVPALIAMIRTAKHEGAIALLNLLLGWTLLGWVGALIWAVADAEREPWGPPEAEKLCPRCAEKVKAAALICRFCGHSFSSPQIPNAEPTER